MPIFGMRNFGWYYALKKPFLNPPSWIFGPVWSVLYVLIILSFFIFIKSESTFDKKIAISVFFIQLLLNLSWTPVFFGLKKIFLALLICTLLWLSIICLILLFYKHSKLASLLLVPYFLWTSFALYLNFSLWILNKN